MAAYINIHTHHPESDTLSVVNIRLQSEHPDLSGHELFTAGVHPWDTANAQPEWLNIFDEKHPGLIAVGETGLDYRPEYQPYDIQKQWFERQIALANELDKPLIIHNVHATDDLLQLLKAHVKVPVIVHGFTGSPEQAGQWLRNVPGLRLSFGPATMHSAKTQQALRFIFAQHPDRFFLETDDRPNISIREMYTFAADLLQESLGGLQEQIEQNFRTLFPQITIR